MVATVPPKMVSGMIRPLQMSARRSLTRGIGEQLRLLDPGLSDLVRTPRLNAVSLSMKLTTLGGGVHHITTVARLNKPLLWHMTLWLRLVMGLLLNI